MNKKIISRIQTEYLKNYDPWYIAFSGGKDSAAVLKLVFYALLELGVSIKPVTILYCDTGVEIPDINNFVKSTLNRIKRKARLFNVPFNVKIVKPRLCDRYFVKVIGRGYPPPSFRFRWCTDCLRINPIQIYIKSLNHQKNVVLLGVRNNESHERNRIIHKYKSRNKYYLKQANNHLTMLFTPIIEYSVSDVWELLFKDLGINIINTKLLNSLYKAANGEYDIQDDTIDILGQKGRFGCWTCTVIRKDRAISSMINKGFPQLKPLLEYRNWLYNIKDKHEFRCKKRRNGDKGPGPFTIEGRKAILKRLIDTQRKSGYKLIDKTEIEKIKMIWEIDKDSKDYMNIENNIRILD